MPQVRKDIRYNNTYLPYGVKRGHAPRSKGGVMERRFVIAEDYDVEGSAPTITESELKRRCEIVASILSGHSPGIREWNEARDILVNGEEKLEDQRCQKICKAHLDSVEQPDPWEEWIEKMPCFGDYDISDYNRYMKQWLRQMPRR